MLTNTQHQPHHKASVKKIRRSRAQWQSIMKKYDASALSQQDFCREQDLAISSFSKWRAQLAAGCKTAPDNDSGNLFVEVAAIDDGEQPTLPWDVELVLKNGAVLRLRQN